MRSSKAVHIRSSSFNATPQKAQLDNGPSTSDSRTLSSTSLVPFKMMRSSSSNTKPQSATHRAPRNIILKERHNIPDLNLKKTNQRVSDYLRSVNSKRRQKTERILQSRQPYTDRNQNQDSLLGKYNPDEHFYCHELIGKLELPKLHFYLGVPKSTNSIPKKDYALISSRKINIENYNNFFKI